MSVTERVSCGITLDASLLYWWIVNVSVLPQQHFSFSTGMDLSSVEGDPCEALSEVLTSERCTHVSRWTARLCGFSAL